MEVERINARQVEIMVEFVRVGEIDTMNERYNAEFNIEAKWIDNLVTDKYDPKVHWNPEIFIENALNTTQVVNYNLDKKHDGSVYVIECRNIKGIHFFFHLNFIFKHSSRTLVFKVHSGKNLN
jgi:hypothetical protein